MRKKYKIENLGCASCAAKMEDGANLDNILEKSADIIKSIEYDARLKQ